MAKLRGLAWDHRRCWGPLDASVALYRAAHPGLEIEWDRRSLYEFGEGAIDTVLAQYDLLVFDHPFVGEIARGRLMVPFDDHLDAAQRAAFERDSVG
jgi:multiple sugar transport system substrate-binding protein